MEPSDKEYRLTHTHANINGPLMKIHTHTVKPSQTRTHETKRHIFFKDPFRYYYSTSFSAISMLEYLR